MFASWVNEKGLTLPVSSRGAMRIPYQLHRGYFLPLCEVVILGTRTNASIKAVIDTGAVRSIFPKSAARDAGLSPESGKPEGVVFGGSTAIGRLLKTYVLIQGRRFSSTFFMSTTAPSNWIMLFWVEQRFSISSTKLRFMAHP